MTSASESNKTAKPVRMLCLGLCGLFLTLMPYFWVLLMPLLAMFGGTTPVLSLSIIILVQTALTSLIPANLVTAEPLIQVGLLVGLLSLPISITPSLLVWIYDHLLYLSQPLWAALEAIGVVKMSVSFGQYLANKIDEQPTLAKGGILLVSGVCYCVILDLCVVVFTSQASFLTIMLIGFVLLLVVIIHLVMYFSEYGVLSDAAIICTWMVALVYFMQQESSQYQHPPHNMQLDRSTSFLRIIFFTATEGLTHAGEVWQFLWQLIHPWFLTSIALRIYTVVWVAHWLIDQDGGEDDVFCDEYDEDSLSASVASWRSPIIVRMAVIFVYTQFVCSNLIHSDSHSLFGIPLDFLQQVSVVRLLQIGLMCGIYCYHLYQGIESDWT